MTIPTPSPSGSRSSASRPPWLRYGVAALAVALASAGAALLRSVLHPLHVLVFVLAVIVTLGLAGVGPGLLAIALSTLVISLLFFEPLGSLWVAGALEQAALALFWVVTLAVALLAAARQQAEADRNRYARQLKALAAASLTVTARLSLDEILRTAAERARDIIGAQYAFASFSRGQGWAGARHAVAGADPAAPLPAFAEAVYRLVVQANQPLRLTHTDLILHHGPSALAAPGGAEPLPITRAPLPNALLAAPLAGHDGRSLGVIQLVNWGAGAFTANDEAVLVQLASFAAVALENSRLYEESQRFNAGLEQRVHERTAQLNALNAALATANERLAAEVASRHAIEAELRRSREQLRQFSSGLQSAREQERARIAREIHDELGGWLTGIKMESAQLRRRLDEGDTALAYARLEAIFSLIDQTITTVRRIATELRPAMLDDFGLLAAIEWQLQEFKRRSGLECRLVMPAGAAAEVLADPARLDPERATGVFRLFQEALTNVARHAQATLVDVIVGVEAGALTLEVRDNGRGIAERELSGQGSLGLLGMRERVRMFDGTLLIRGAPGRGTTVLVRVPLGAPAAAPPDTALNVIGNTAA